MGSYRFYILDDSGHILDHRDHLCGDDLDALDIAKFLYDRNPVELWTGSRLVAHVNRNDAEHSVEQSLSG